MNDEMPEFAHCAPKGSDKFVPEAPIFRVHIYGAGVYMAEWPDKPHSCVIPLRAERGYVALRRIRKKMESCSRARKVVAPWGRADLRMLLPRCRIS
jgi:hypothetical protein